jgi:PDZ domain
MKMHTPWRQFTYASVLPAALSVILAAGRAIPMAAADDPGTIGIGVAQLFSDGQANKRGPLVVMRVMEGSPGAKAGIERGDIVVAVNGVPAPGRDVAEIVGKDLRGPVGGQVRLTVIKVDGNPLEVTLTRVPYPPHPNPSSDPFAYVMPGSWQADPRYPFPLPWAPALAYHGTEDLAFTPNFDDTASPEYHSYMFFWWLQEADAGVSVFTAKQLESDMLVYFRGLAEERAKYHKFTADLSKVAATYRADPVGASTFGGVPAQAFSGTVNIYDGHGKVITLNSEVVMAACPGTGHTAFFFGMSQQLRDQTIWKQLDAVRDSFRCKR